MTRLLTELSLRLGRGRICLIQVLIHQPSLQTKQINACLLRTHRAHDVHPTPHASSIIPELSEPGHHLGRAGFKLLLGAEVKLIGLTLIAMEEDDGLGCGVVDFNNSCCLYQTLNTYFIDFDSRCAT